MLKELAKTPERAEWLLLFYRYGMILVNVFIILGLIAFFIFYFTR